jgi:hypothetical protein
MGSFQADSLGPQQGVGADRKVWVSSKRSGNDTAVLVVADPKGGHATQRRPPRMGSVAGVEQFFPGVIRVRLPGAYRLDVTVGSDRMCVTVNYRV